MTKRYKVVGPHTVMGHRPGAEFDADLTEEKERQMLRGGHLALVPAAVTPASRRRRTTHRRRGNESPPEAGVREPRRPNPGGEPTEAAADE